MIWERLGHYENLASIGTGGMDEVWKARDVRLGRIVAIKKVKEQHSEGFKQEARLIAALNHPSAAAGRNQGFENLMNRPRAFSRQLSALSFLTNTVSIRLLYQLFIVVRLDQFQIPGEKKLILQLTRRASGDGR